MEFYDWYQSKGGKNVYKVCLAIFSSTFSSREMQQQMDCHSMEFAFFSESKYPTHRN